MRGWVSARASANPPSVVHGRTSPLHFHSVDRRTQPQIARRRLGICDPHRRCQVGIREVLTRTDHCRVRDWIAACSCDVTLICAQAICLLIPVLTDLIPRGNGRRVRDGGRVCRRRGGLRRRGRRGRLRRERGRHAGRWHGIWFGGRRGRRSRTDGQDDRHGAPRAYSSHAARPTASHPGADGREDDTWNLYPTVSVGTDLSESPARPTLLARSIQNGHGHRFAPLFGLPRTDAVLASATRALS